MEHFIALLDGGTLQFHFPDDPEGDASLTIIVGLSFADYPMVKRRINQWSLESQASMLLLKKEDGTPAYPMAQPNDSNSIIITSLNYDKAREILAVFSDVTKLTFISYHGDGSEFKYLAMMLNDDQWSSQLTSLKLLNCRPAHALHCCALLFAAINGLDSLQTLWLDLGRVSHFPELPILRQLSEVRLQCPDSQFPAFIDSLEKFVAADNPNRLLIDLPNGQLLFFELERRATSRLCRLFSRLSNWNLYNSSLNVSAFCSNYSQLTSITFAFPSGEIEQIFTAFGQLEHLVHLRLTINFGDRALHGNFRLKAPWFSASDQYFASAAIIPDPVPLKGLCLKTVKALDLKLIFPSHVEVRWLNLAVTMPSLQSIVFGKYVCRECKDFGLYNYREPVLQCDSEISIRCFERFLDDLHPGSLLYFSVDNILAPARKLLAHKGNIDEIDAPCAEIPYA